MKTFEQYSKNDEMVELFISLAHLDELYIYYRTNDDWLFDQNKIKKEFWISYDIFMVFERHFNDSDIFNFIASMIEKYFNLKGYRTTH